MRLSEDILLQIVPKNELKPFKKINQQFVENTDILLKNWVWSESAKPYPSSVDGSEIKSGRINHLFNKELFDIKNNYGISDYKYQEATILLRQGFKTQGIFAFLITLIGENTHIFYNQIVPIESFRFTAEQSRLKLSGDFWTVQYTFLFPIVQNISDKNLFISVIPLTYQDIETDINNNSFGLIYKYGEIKDTLEPIIYEKLLPNTIQTNIEKKGSYFIIKPYHTDSNITIQQALIDYLQLDADNVHSFDVIHKVSVGNQNTENYKTNIYQNYDNPFGPVSIVPYVTTEMFDDNNDIEIILETTYVINNMFRLIRRTSKLFPDIKQILDNSIFDRLISTRFQPINIQVNDNDIINNNIIETKTIERYTELVVHKYVEMVTDRKIKYERKIIGFKNLVREENKSYSLIVFSDDSSVVYNIPALNNDSYLTFDLNIVESDKLYKKLVKDGYLHYNIVQLIESFGNSEQIIEKGVLIP